MIIILIIKLAAVKAQEYVEGEELGRGFIPMFGFTDKKIFSDIRFKIGVALREAGVHMSSAARTIVNQLHPRPQAPIVYA